MNAQIKSIRDQVLEYLQDKQPLTVGEIARALLKEASNVHRVCKDLMDAGLVLGEEGPNRATVYSLLEEDALKMDAPEEPARDPTNPARVPPIAPRPTLTTVSAPQPMDPASDPPEPTRRQRRSRVSSADFMKLFAELSSDSEKLQRIRSILEE
jgi:DNA-binding MarR family transcriptional regulator